MFALEEKFFQERNMSCPVGLRAWTMAVASLARRRRPRLIAAAMLALTLIVFEMNGRAPRGVNLRPRDVSATVALVGEGSAQKLRPGSC